MIEITPREKYLIELIRYSQRQILKAFGFKPGNGDQK